MATPYPALSRRGILRATGLAAPFVFTGGRAFAADQITAADVGGAPATAMRNAFYDPFEKETGIRVVNVAHESDPTVQFKLAVDSRSYIWDLCMVTPAHVANLTRPKPYLDALNLQPVPGVIEGMLTPDWAGFSVFATVLAYRKDRFGENPPQTWADYFDVAKFPGRRALYRAQNGPLEIALMADGVAPKDLYPLDVNRAFRKLDTIKRNIAVWWTSGAQNTQLLQSGEVDMADTWGARAYAAMESGAPVGISFKQGVYSSDGWSLLRGTPRADLARRFVAFCLRPEQQAIYSNTVANGPSNQRAYDFIRPERAAILPTSPQNLPGLAPVDNAWWAANKNRVQERFQDWLLG
ncbi:ABC transporter substrate-binding protein [Roseomonas indoligenes]|uniref:ABC transporter substrate-binding protein n=1 Tax=Roseomonas indoligenes TaxID=2820811 RepID=A0A940MZZ9_9PROT|nr:ABC transporter substrate-binding protein [Pararoseomonas indoligenes]MBP0491812.1 ABC transporter substrate-binding protein [Pararoseomonas indoligenes]